MKSRRFIAICLSLIMSVATFSSTSLANGGNADPLRENDHSNSSVQAVAPIEEEISTDEAISVGEETPTDEAISVEEENPVNEPVVASEKSTTISKTDGYFYIRLDGKIPYEPGSYEASDYTEGIQIKDSVTVQDWIVDVDTTKSVVGNCVANDVVAKLNKTPNDELIKSVCAKYNVNYNPDTHYILWYVQKYQSLASTALNESGKWITTNGEGWHIDGVLLERSKVSISYAANVPDGVTTIPDVPLGYQVYSKTTVTVGESGGVGGNRDREKPSIVGYTFNGWNTKSDGTGTAYGNGTKIDLAESMTLYAMWSKNNNPLKLNKVDGFGKSLDGAYFTLTDTDGTTNVGFTAGSYENNKILTDTVYTVTETAAPDNYKELEGAFSFIVSSQGGTKMTAYFCDDDGNKLTTAPENVTISYTKEAGVNIEVTNIGYFYIFHTANVAEGTSFVEVPMIPGESGNWNEDGTYNIVKETTEGFLYGGYYTDYAKKGEYTDNNRTTEGSDTYKGDKTSWNSENVCKDKGTAITPEVGKTYFLKEVPNTYLHPVTYVVYDTSDNNSIKKLYLMTATDDANYSKVGFNTTNTTGGIPERDIDGALYEEVKVSKVGEEYDTLTSNNVFNIDGCMAASDDIAEKYVIENGTYTEIPYFVTLDGVKVTGNQKLKVYLRDTTYTNWKKPGITKLAQKATISAQ